MGGHGGLNILPQKKWNVYNFDNREKVQKDEEAAAKEEQLKREQARKRDAEFRLEQLRTARGLAPVNQGEEKAAVESKPGDIKKPAEVESKPGHINLFEGIKIFDPIKVLEKEGGDGKNGFKKNKKMKKEEQPRVVTAEDEKYRLGYGVAGEGVKLPWYLERPSADANDESGEDDERRDKEDKKNKSGKKTLEELREERLRREKREKERERTLILKKRRNDRAAFTEGRLSRRIAVGWMLACCSDMAVLIVGFPMYAVVSNTLFRDSTGFTLFRGLCFAIGAAIVLVFGSLACWIVATR